MWRIDSHGGTKYTPFLRIRGATMRVEKKNWRFSPLASLWPILAFLNFSKNLSVYIILVPDTTFVPNLTFLGILSPEISFGEKNSHPLTQTDRQLILPSMNQR